MSTINNYLKQFPNIQEIIKESKLNNRLEISGANQNFASLISSYLFEENKENYFIIAPNIYQAQKIYDDLSNFIDNIYFYPKDDFLSTEFLTESLEFKIERINTIKHILFDKNKKMIVTSLSTLLSKATPKEEYIKHIITLNTSDFIKPQRLIEELVLSGYKRVYTTEKQGEASLRGGILDIFPINSNIAYRIEFFGDEIESIRELDIESQRSKNNISNILIMPLEEVFYNDTQVDTIRFYLNDKLDNIKDEHTREKIEDDLLYLDTKKEHGHLQKYLSLFIKDNYSIVDYLDNKTVIFFDYDNVKNQAFSIENEITEYFNQYKDYFRIDSLLNNNSTYTFKKEIYFTKTKQFFALKELDFNISDVVNYNNRLDLFNIDLLKAYKGKTIIISLSDKSFNVFCDFLNEKNISYNVNEIIKGSINILKDTPLLSLEILDIDSVFITEDKLFKTFKARKGKYNNQVETKRLKSINDLKIGDYVVHYDYGIGRFKEIKTMTVGKTTSDYIHIEYDNDESLYTPVEKIYSLSKYSSEEGYVPKLSKLSGKEWEKTKTSARQKAKDLAERLMSLYSTRENEIGFIYKGDKELEKEFKDEFTYDLTIDQEKTILEVEKDMESDKLMDRLICGDVGFGKTEVALRAAFKAAISGKQVAYLCPTTILSRQHYYTFKERMDKFGIEVGVLNRFVSNKKIKDYLYRLKRGTLDILIGTHRLLSNDVEFNNLGLLIIDEEQRFGVEAKEKLKELKTNVDVLTLTATPIPRTLEMTIAGIKDISLIETPPKNRYPVQTYVLERNDYIVKDAIEKEMSKGGQVFYLYNRVEDMDRIYRCLTSLVPDAHIDFIHGQMNKNEIEDTISRFIDKEIDVLLTTTIIETGIDIPNVNTLIVHDADRYGLSQLYQIKGRVGRSDKIGYAYLMYDKNKTITEEATKRLEAIKDFTELGSGFKIAVRDLTTRGAGEILGKEQSGFMNRVGVELYLKLLEEEVNKIKGIEVKNKEQDLRLNISRHIPSSYIEDEYVKIEVHTKISRLYSINELNKLKSELEDRFGKIPDILYEYMYSKLSENLLNTTKFERVDLLKEKIVMVIDKETSSKISGEKLFKTALDISENFYFYYKANKIFVVYIQKSTEFEAHKDITLFLETINKDKMLD